MGTSVRETKLTASLQLENLPLELERIIFELAALSHFPGSIPTLMLVAYRVKGWSGSPVHYRMFSGVPSNIIVGKTGPGASLPRCTLEVINRVARDKPDVLRSVRSLMFILRDPTQGRTVLAACPNVVNLYISGNFPRSAYPALELLHLQHLSCDMQHFFLHAPWSRSALNHITHLRLFSTSKFRYVPKKDWVGLICLPQLTHCILPDELPQCLALCRAILAGMTVLRVLIVDLPCPHSTLDLEVHRRFDVYEPIARDPRFMLMSVHDHQTDWETAVLTGVSDHWARADQFIAQRGAGASQSGDLFPFYAQDN